MLVSGGKFWYAEARMKSALAFLGDVAKTVLIALLIVIPIRAFVFQPFLVRGNSMEPSYHNGDYLIVDEFSYHFRGPERGEVIVFEYPRDPSQRYIKRVVGLPGEIVEIADGKVVVYEEDEKAFVLGELYTEGATMGSGKISLREGEYYMLGDNREHSSDSRTWGPVPEEYIIGRAFLRVFPLSAFAMVESTEYEE